MSTIAVLGAGLGGIAAAIRLQSRGHQVSVYERLNEPGGRARCFIRDGIYFDAGPTVITAPFLIDELFSLARQKREEQIDLLPVTPWYRYLLPDGRRFDYGSNPEEVLQRVTEFSPQDRTGYLRMREYCARLYEEGYNKRGDQPFHRMSSMLSALPALLGLRADRSVFAAVSTFIKDPALREVLSVHPLLVGGHPFRTSSIYMLIHHLEQAHGVWFVKGGTNKLVSALVSAAESMGVRFEYSRSVSKLRKSGSSIRAIEFDQGELVEPDKVVSNIDPVNLYSRLQSEHSLKRWRAPKLRGMRQSMGLYVLYFATHGEYPDLAHHTIILDEDYRKQLDDIFDGDQLPAKFSAYLHRPKSTDKEIAPEGVDAFYVLVPVPNLRSGLDWKVIEPDFRQKVIEFLQKRCMPDLQQKLKFSFSITPQYFYDELQSTDGSGFSIHPDLLQSAYFRFHNQSEEADNLYLVGAGTHPGAGVPGVLTSAKLLDRLIPSVPHVSK
jgi:phytoene desaturase